MSKYYITSTVSNSDNSPFSQKFGVGHTKIYHYTKNKLRITVLVWLIYFKSVAVRKLCSVLLKYQKHSLKIMKLKVPQQD